MRTPTMPGKIPDSEYSAILQQAVEIIKTARVRISKQLNTTVLSSYWEIGKLLSERKLESKYGDSVVRRLSSDLKSHFPNMGLQPRNLWNMKCFYLRYYQEDEKVQRLVALLPWSHNLLLLNYNLEIPHIVFYAQEVYTKGWSRSMLLHALKSNLHLSVQTVEQSNNFAFTLPESQVGYANEAFRSHYNLGFIHADKPLKELALERRLIERITTFVMELGYGFSFIGNQYALTYGGKEYHVDLLFFHRKLHRMVAIELKIGEFKPEYVGKMNFYLSLLDKLEKTDDENPSIGIILCAEKDHLEVELALQDVQKPISVAEYQYLLPESKLQEILVNEMKK